ncbi:MAG: HipA family kinase [Chitinophagales bacterium]
MIPKKETAYLIEEIPTDGHSPLKFICTDREIYFCKYRVSPKKIEIDCLVYEAICSILLRKLEIPTPNIAFVEVKAGSYNKEDLIKNKLYTQPGIICFGSKELPNAQLVTELDKISKTEDFEKFENPKDLIRVAIFDLWVGNTDRGKGGSNFAPGRSNNYNLLTMPFGNKKQIIAFDHGFAFDGEHGLGIFNEKFLPDIKGKLFGTQFFNDILSYITLEERRQIAIAFIEKIQKMDVDAVVSSVYSQLPVDWKRIEGLKDKIIAYLSSGERLEVLIRIVNEQIIGSI